MYTYEKLKSAGKKFEVVFVSSDRSEEWFNQYASTMPWLSVPYTDTTRLQMLKTSFGVDGMLNGLKFHTFLLLFLCSKIKYWFIRTGIHKTLSKYQTGKTLIRSGSTFFQPSSVLNKGTRHV